MRWHSVVLILLVPMAGGCTDLTGLWSDEDPSVFEMQILDAWTTPGGCQSSDEQQSCTVLEFKIDNSKTQERVQNGPAWDAMLPDENGTLSVRLPALVVHPSMIAPGQSGEFTAIYEHEAGTFVQGISYRFKPFHAFVMPVAPELLDARRDPPLAG